MSTTVEAYLAWGFDLGTAKPWGDNDWEDAYAAAVGRAPPHSEFRQDDGRDWAVYWEAQREALAKAGCVVELYGDAFGDGARRFVAVKQSVHVAGLDKAVRVSTKVGGKWEKRLRQFCELMEIPWNEPEWILMAYWG